MTDNGYVEPVQNLPPELPVERFDAWVHLRSIYLVGLSMRANRRHFDGDDETGSPDSILLDVYLGNDVSAGIKLTPAMIVHLANSLLTDNERAAIRQPAATEATV